MGAFSVLEVIDSVKRVSGVNFEVKLLPRRAGDPAAVIANSDRIRAEFHWPPRHGDPDDRGTGARLGNEAYGQARRMN
jgi:UDP-glucose 4-epimerase